MRVCEWVPGLNFAPKTEFLPKFQYPHLKMKTKSPASPTMTLGHYWLTVFYLTDEETEAERSVTCPRSHGQ